MSSWEQRMSARAQQRQAAAAAEARRAHPFSHEPGSPHAGHHTHLRGTMTECSCGEFLGLTSVVFPPEWDSMTPEEISAEIDKIICSRCNACGVAGPLEETLRL